MAQPHSKPEPHLPRFTNRLARETSPYLLQHAHNPVDWFAWGPEAFDEARRTQKPILVSIGYSTCYWCHVMERESFEDEAVARVMNERFVCVKVDREERPDVDDVYMAAVQTLTGSGGWPMNVFLTPPPPPPSTSSDGPSQAPAWKGLQPFWGGTYYPPDDRYGRPSWTHMLHAVSQAWREQRDEIVAQSDRLAAAVAERLAVQARAVPVGARDVGQAVATLLRLFDERHGGFGRAPKFPQPVFLQLLLDARDSIDDEGTRRRVDQALSLTLDRMAMGGMYDQVGGGFHRYSVDERWLVPHFEKMLYDNGQLAAVYALAAESIASATAAASSPAAAAAAAGASGVDPYYGEIAAETCDYILREMTDEATGAFYSAQDAEVHHREGLNYLWTPEEVREALEAAGEAALIDFALDAYGLSAGTNFQDPHHPDEPARNVLFLVSHPHRLAERFRLPRAEIDVRLRRINAALLAARARRDQPGTDDKVIAAWNGLMIAGLAETGRVLGRTDLLDAARRAWAFIDANMRAPDGGLLRTYRGGRAKVEAFCEDYTMLAHGLLALHRATGNRALLDDAAGLVAQARERFWDDDRGGYFDTLAGRDDLFVRARSTHDGALPSAAGVMLHNLIDLHELARGEERYLDDALSTLASLSPDLHESPVASANAARGLLRLLGIAPQWVAEIGVEDAGKGRAVSAAAVSVGPSPRLAADEDLPPLPIEPVRVSTSTLEVVVPADGAPARFDVRLDIERGVHVNAHDPGDESLVGLALEIVGAADPDALQLEVDYPPGKPFEMGGQRSAVYEGRVMIPAMLRAMVGRPSRPSEGRDARPTTVATTTSASSIAGQPMLALTYQACTATECRPPVRGQVPVMVKVVGA